MGNLEVLEKNDLSLNVLSKDSHPQYLRQLKKLAVLHNEGSLSNKELKAIHKAAPHVAQALEQVSRSAAKSQIKMAETQGSTARDAIGVVGEFARKADTDKERLGLAETLERMNIDNNQTSRTMNADNNRTWRVVAKAAGGLLAVGFFLARRLR